MVIAAKMFCVREWTLIGHCELATMSNHGVMELIVVGRETHFILQRPL